MTCTHVHVNKETGKVTHRGDRAAHDEAIRQLREHLALGDMEQSQIALEVLQHALLPFVLWPFTYCRCSSHILLTKNSIQHLCHFMVISTYDYTLKHTHERLKRYKCMNHLHRGGSAAFLISCTVRLSSNMCMKRSALIASRHSFGWYARWPFLTTCPSSATGAGTA